MSVSPEVKLEVINKYKIHDGDTGSSEVQVAILTRRIENLTEHLKQHVKDHSSRRGLIKLVNQRRRQLGFLKKRNQDRYQNLVKQLELRG